MNGNSELFHNLKFIKELNSKVYIAIGHSEFSFHYFWLRDHCRCPKCYNISTFQRAVHILDIPQNIKPQKVHASKGSLFVTWEDRHESVYSSEFFLENNHNAWILKQSRKIRLWRGDELKNTLPKVSNDDFLNNDYALQSVLESLILYGVAFVDGVPTTEVDTENAIKRIATPQSTLFGNMWSVTTDPLYSDTAYSTIRLASHNDSTYFTESTGLQVFHCLEESCEGGETVLLDGFETVSRMAPKYPKELLLLSTKGITTEYLGDGHNFKHTAPIIKYNEITGNIEQIRYNVYDRSPFTSMPEEEIMDYYRALRLLAEEIENKENQWCFKLKPGRLLIFDNWRILHGREAFRGKRYLSGSYISRSDWLSKARTFGLLG